MNERIYMSAVLVVFSLLLLSRIPALRNRKLDKITIVSTIVELGFLIWGIVILWE
jgi:hypothetical protein